MYQFYVNDARVEQFQQQARHEAAVERSITALKNKVAEQVVVFPRRAYLRLLLAAFKAAIRFHPA